MRAILLVAVLSVVGWGVMLAPAVLGFRKAMELREPRTEEEMIKQEPAPLSPEKKAEVDRNAPMITEKARPAARQMAQQITTNWQHSEVVMKHYFAMAPGEAVADEDLRQLAQGYSQDFGKLVSLGEVEGETTYLQPNADNQLDKPIYLAHMEMPATFEKVQNARIWIELVPTEKGWGLWSIEIDQDR